MKIQYIGQDHVREITSDDLGVTPEGEEPTKWVWDIRNGGVTDVENEDAVDALLRMSSFSEYEEPELADGTGEAEVPLVPAEGDQPTEGESAQSSRGLRRAKPPVSEETAEPAASSNASPE